MRFAGRPLSLGSPSLSRRCPGALVPELKALLPCGCRNPALQILESFGDVKMIDLSGASARRMVIIVAIMTLHSFGEGSGVGVSYAGPRGFSQGLLVTIAIAVHNIPEGMAISMVLASQGVRPSRAMLWSIFTSLPQVGCSHRILTYSFPHCFSPTLKRGFAREDARISTAAVENPRPH